MHYNIIDMADDPRCGQFAALADGLHIARFYQKLDEELAALAGQWNESKYDFYYTL